MICPEMLRKIDTKVSELEYQKELVQKDNDRIKRILKSVISEWDAEGCIDVDILRELAK